MFNKKEYINKLKEAKSVCLSNNDNYYKGMYNGIEYALALAENREPQYLLEDIDQQKDLKVTKRTQSGAIRK